MTIEAEVFARLDDDIGTDVAELACSMRWTRSQISSALASIKRKGWARCARWRETFVWHRTDPLGQLVERSDGDAMGTVTAVENKDGLPYRYRVHGMIELGREERSLWLSEPELLRSWRPLGLRADVQRQLDEHMVGVSSCLRCGRLNFGPCISRTCADLRERRGDPLGQDGWVEP